MTEKNFAITWKELFTMQRFRDQLLGYWGILGGKPFTISTATSMMRNISYAGVLQIGEYSRGKFCTVANGEAIIIEGAHKAIVSRDVIDRVQEILADRL